MNALYSTPSIYTDAKNAANQQWPLKIDDYFPYGSTCFVNDICLCTNKRLIVKLLMIDDDFYHRYADGPHDCWTGYYTSRPAFKRYVRILSGYYLV